MTGRRTRVAIFGSTGSIGQQTLTVARALGDTVEVVGLAANKNIALLAAQAREFAVRWVASPQFTDPERSRALLPEGTTILSLEDLARHPAVDLVVMATVGRAGLLPTVAAIEAGKRVALANKEVLVMAGALLTTLARRTGAVLLPIDSEHSAIWQCLQGEDREAVARVILTASGGAFRDYPPEALQRVTPAEALQHPVWQMGPKVTIDSATLMNKGFEVIEAHWLFDLPYEKIAVLLHRESIIHSLVEFVDGAVKAQLAVPDMRLPIQYALTYPTRHPGPTPRLDLARLGKLHFEPLDLARYPCFRLALEAGQRGATYPTALAAADDVAVEAFLAGQIGFLDIPAIIEEVLADHQPAPAASLEAVLAADEAARQQARARIAARQAGSVRGSTG